MEERRQGLKEVIAYFLGNIASHQDLSLGVGMQPVSEITAATGGDFKLFGNTAIGIAVYQLHGKRAA